MPFLNWIPEALAPFKQEAHAIFDETLSLFKSHVDDVRSLVSALGDPVSDSLFPVAAQVREAVAGGDDAHCFTKYILQQQESYQLSDNEATFLAGAMFGAGSDTTADGISTFIMTMVTHPEIQKTAQEELDRVVGRDRLPNFADQPDLVYIGAIVREMMRWRTIIAGGLAHCSTEDDTYNGARVRCLMRVHSREADGARPPGYFIPKGTVVLANHWAIHMDPVSLRRCPLPTETRSN